MDKTWGFRQQGAAASPAAMLAAAATLVDDADQDMLRGTLHAGDALLFRSGCSCLSMHLRAKR